MAISASQALPVVITCGSASAAHVETTDAGKPMLVRFVCTEGCQLTDQFAFAALPLGQRALTA